MTSTPVPSATESRPLHVRFRKFLGRLRRRFNVDRYDVFLREVPAEDAPLASPAEYGFAWGTPEDIAGCDEFHTELDERERRAGVARLGYGHKVVVAFHGDEIVFSMWVNPRNLNVPGLMKRALAEDQWFIYKAYTSPDHRGKKLYQSGMRFVLSEMRAAGKRQLVGYAHVKKRISRRGLAALSFTSGGRAVQYDCPGLRRVSLSSELVRAFPRALEPSGVPMYPDAATIPDPT